METLEKSKKTALLALQNKPSKYYVDVLDDTSLPDSLKGRKKIAFTIKPPTLATLTEIGLIIQELPSELFDPKNTGMTKKAMAHIEDIVRIIATMAHGKPKKKLPEWYVPFLAENLTVEETLQLWFEVSQKLQTGFFLPFFQIARQMNPMMMENPRGSTLGA